MKQSFDPGPNNSNSSAAILTTSCQRDDTFEKSCEAPRIWIVDIFSSILGHGKRLRIRKFGTARNWGAGETQSNNRRKTRWKAEENKQMRREHVSDRNDRLTQKNDAVELRGI